MRKSFAIFAIESLTTKISTRELAVMYMQATRVLGSFLEASVGQKIGISESGDWVIGS